MIGRGVLNEKNLSEVSNNVATSSCAPTNAPLIKTGMESNKVFMFEAGDLSPVSEKA